ncbi:hypothetical protein [Methanobrevibacter sp.]|uniref:hypothetical protein n=1 Tax=Methanobrevibacter sp. TaxID=66852 RepID=UPI003890B568
MLIEKIKSLPQTEETLSDLFSLMLQLEDVDKQIELNKWIRTHARKIKSQKAFELIHKTYIFGGKYSFDDYMVACEWNREPQARFWLPRRKVLEGKHKIATQIQEFIDDPNSLYLGFSLPPGTGKTTLIKFLLSYISGKFPQSANMYVSYSDALTKMMYDSITAIMTDTFEYCHNDVFDNGSPTVSAEYKTISFRKKGDFPTIGLISLGGSVTGRTRANKFLITDDLVKNKEEARSPERLNKLFEDYSATLTTRTIGDNVKQIMLGTIWSSHDPISKMKAKYGDDPRYKFIAIPVWDEDRHSNFCYDHPDRYTDERIKDLEASLDPVDFSCLYLQRGIDKEGLAFGSDTLRYYNGVLPDGEPDNVAFCTDIAWGGGDSLSMPIAYIYGEDVYIHDVIFDNRDKFATKPRVVGKILQHKCKMGRMEANNGGDEYCDDVNKMLREQNYSINLSHKKAPTRMSKLTRIEQHAPNIRKFYFRDTSCRDKEYQKFMDEVTSFSFTSKNLHDDAPDSLSMLVDYLFTGIKSVKSCPRPF